MRKLIASFFISLDGVVEAPDKWHFPYFNDEMGQAVGEAIAATDSMLLGRRTYEEWAAFWPQQDPASDPFVSVMNETPKFDASRTLDKVEWQNSTLLERGVLDELRLLVHPLVVGSGTKLFPDGASPVSLELVDSKTFSTGVLDLTYRPAAA
jgi:dihydrofolate reductase